MAKKYRLSVTDESTGQQVMAFDVKRVNGTPGLPSPTRAPRPKKSKPKRTQRANSILNLKGVKKRAKKRYCPPKNGRRVGQQGGLSALTLKTDWLK